MTSKEQGSWVTANHSVAPNIFKTTSNQLSQRLHIFQILDLVASRKHNVFYELGPAWTELFFTRGAQENLFSTASLSCGSLQAAVVVVALIYLVLCYSKSAACRVYCDWAVFARGTNGGARILNKTFVLLQPLSRHFADIKAFNLSIPNLNYNIG